jgi:hypothetical protein
MPTAPTSRCRTTPTHDLLAAHYAVHPDSGFVQLSEPDVLAVADDGRMKFTAGSGVKVRSLAVALRRRTKSFRRLSSAPAPSRRRSSVAAPRGPEEAVKWRE